MTEQIEKQTLTSFFKTEMSMISSSHEIFWLRYRSK